MKLETRERKLKEEEIHNEEVIKELRNEIEESSELLNKLESRIEVNITALRKLYFQFTPPFLLECVHMYEICDDENPFRETIILFSGIILKSEIVMNPDIKRLFVDEGTLRNLIFYGKKLEELPKNLHIHFCEIYDKITKDLLKDEFAKNKYKSAADVLLKAVKYVLDSTAISLNVLRIKARIEKKEGDLLTRNVQKVRINAARESFSEIELQRKVLNRYKHALDIVRCCINKNRQKSKKAG